MVKAVDKKSAAVVVPVPAARTVKRVGGRPPYVPTEEHVRQVETMVIAGVPRMLMARIIGIDKKTFKRAFVPQLRTAKARSIMTVVSNLYEMTKTSERACEFFLTNMDPENWKPMHQQGAQVQIDNSVRTNVEGQLGMKLIVTGGLPEPELIEHETPRAIEHAPA